MGDRNNRRRQQRVVYQGVNPALDDELSRTMWGGGQQEQDDLASAEGDLNRVVRDKARAARRLLANQEADAILNPPSNGGDNVAAEAYRAASGIFQEAATFQTQQANAARQAAADASARNDQARREGVEAGLRVADRETAAVRAEAATQVSALSEVSKLAIETVKQVSATQMDAVREASNARVEAAKGEATFYRNMFEQLLGVSTQARQAQPAQQPQDPMATATSIVQGVGGLLAAVQGISGPATTDPRIQAQAEATKTQAEGFSTFLGEAGKALGTVATEIAPGLKGLFNSKPSADPGGSRNGIPNTPPPPPQ